MVINSLFILFQLPHRYIYNADDGWELTFLQEYLRNKRRERKLIESLGTAPHKVANSTKTTAGVQIFLEGMENLQKFSNLPQGSERLISEERLERAVGAGRRWTCIKDIWSTWADPLPHLQEGICCSRRSRGEVKVRDLVHLPLSYTDSKIHPTPSFSRCGESPRPIIPLENTS